MPGVGRSLEGRRYPSGAQTDSGDEAPSHAMDRDTVHALGNLLAIVLIAAQLIQERPDDREMVQRCGERILSAARRASALVERTRPRRSQG